MTFFWKNMFLDTLMASLYSKFEAVMRFDDVSPDTVCLFMLTCSHMVPYPEELVKTCKRHFVVHPERYNPLNVSKFLSALRSMNALDEAVMESVEKTTFAGLAPIHHSIGNRRELAKVLSTWNIIHEKVCMVEMERAGFSFL